MPRILLASVSLACFTAAALVAAPAFAATVRTTLHVATPAGPGAEVGTATINDSPQGAMITLDLHGLPPGQRGMHVHQNGSCAASKGPDGKPVPAGAAGAHFDPARTGRHMGPEGPGHLGDLPRVDVAADGTARANLKAPRIKDVSVLKGRALIVHAGGDTYSEPPPLGGGGARFACGVLE
jgi:Cu-Zn family superoxide dismutase